MKGYPVTTNNEKAVAVSAQYPAPKTQYLFFYIKIIVSNHLMIIMAALKAYVQRVSDGCWRFGGIFYTSKWPVWRFCPWDEIIGEKGPGQVG